MATTTERSVLQQLDLLRRFDAKIAVPNVNSKEELDFIMRNSGAFSESDSRRAVREIEEVTGSENIGVGIKSILTGIKTAKQDSDQVSRFVTFMAENIAEQLM